MEIRTPLIAILVLLTLLAIYARRNMLQLSSARIFFIFVLSAFVNAVCEVLECMVFIYFDNAFFSMRRMTQNLYVSSLIITIYLMAVYAYSKLTAKRLISKKIAVLMGLPAFSGVVLMFVGTVYSARDINGMYYTYGPAVNHCYLIGFVYILAIIAGVLIFRGRIKKEDFRALVIGLMIWVALAIVQSLNNSLQLSSLGIMLMALILFLGVENPREYYEKAVPNVLNREAFILMLAEKLDTRKTFFIVSVIFLGKTNVLTGNDRDHLHELEKRISSRAAEIGAAACSTGWNTLEFVVNTPEKVESFMSMINTFSDPGNMYKLIFSVLEIPKCTSELDQAMQILDYVANEYVYTQSSPNLVIDSEVVDKMIYRNSIEDVVRQAINDKAFDVYYQPILCVKTGAFASCEALVRLRRPNTESYISPEDFIPIAEKCGLVQEIDDLVFEKVCSFIARENLSSYGVNVVEVNLSGNEVVDPQTHDRLRHKMEKYHIPPKFINFEITETSYINNDEVFKSNVTKLKELGSTFSMDDFGSGYSNLLEILKMDYFLVKMDKEFVWSCLDPDKPENLRMMDYTIKFLKDFGLHILAEGVENLDQAKLLIDKGIEYLQGFYYSRPVPEDEYLEFLKAQKGIVSIEG